MDELYSARLYLNEAGSFARLTAEDETNLAIQIQAAMWERTQPLDLQDRETIERGLKARKTMIEANLLLVVDFARRRTRKSFPEADARQCGNIGLLYAVDHFDPNYRTEEGGRVRFSTYAKSWIKKEISKGAKKDLRSVRLPDNIIEQIGNWKKAARAIEAEGLEPTIERIAERMGVDPIQVELAQLYDLETLSLDQPIGGEEEHLTLGDTVADPSMSLPTEHIEHEEMSEGMQDVLFSLTDHERMIVQMRFGFSTGSPQPLERVAREFGRTRERIRQVEADALAKLSRPSRKTYLKSIQ